MKSTTSHQSKNILFHNRFRLCNVSSGNFLKFNMKIGELAAHPLKFLIKNRARVNYFEAAFDNKINSLLNIC